MAFFIELVSILVIEMLASWELGGVGTFECDLISPSEVKLPNSRNCDEALLHDLISNSRVRPVADI